MIYVHVPFCKRFCTYCDFYSEIADEGCFKTYADNVCAEIKRRAGEMDDNLKKNYEDYLPLFTQVVEEVKNESSEEA